MSALLSLLLFTSCGMFDDDASCQTDSDAKGYLSVKVNVAGDGTSSSTRAEGDYNPDGGEDGNGRETGFENEYEVNNVTLLLYKADNGINGSGDATISYAYYFDNLTGTTGSTGYDITYTSSTKECDRLIISNGPYNVIVIANAGDMTGTFLNAELSTVRDYIFTSAWTYSEGEYSNFIMTSEDDASTSSSSTTGSGTKASPLVVSVNIERLAARIDIEPNEGAYNNTDNGYTYNYNVLDKTDETKVIGGFVLESILPYNKLTSGEYLIKRVTEGTTTSSISYLGDETETEDKATNYVLDPWTLGKGTTMPSGLIYNQSKVDDWTSISGFINVKAVESDKSYFILDYTMENTTTDNSETYSTGLVFKGKYYDISNWDSENKQPKEDATYTEKYYTYTIRHSDPDGKGTTTDPMYYGIVRNNIYRIKIEKILGDDVLVITINVKDWTVLSEEEVPLTPSATN
ncbi:MAG: fimbria major subunit, partial [Prevotellaceae bacterium]|nr:fimbria major subunit [Prevotellaceae bacterium]